MWGENEQYKRGQEIIGSLQVVNDTAERGVKLIQEFNSRITKNEDQKQYLLQVYFIDIVYFFICFNTICISFQVVQEYRKKYPGHNRSILI